MTVTGSIGVFTKWAVMFVKKKNVSSNICENFELGLKKNNIRGEYASKEGHEYWFIWSRFQGKLQLHRSSEGPGPGSLQFLLTG